MQVEIAIPSYRCVIAPASASARAGITYERRVSNWLEQEPGIHFYPQLEFNTSKGLIRPDGLLFTADHRRCVVVEVKAHWRESVIGQIRRYQEALTWWLGAPVGGLVICASAGAGVGAGSLPLVGSLSEVWELPLSLLMRSSRLLPVVGAKSDGLVEWAGSGVGAAIREVGSARNYASSRLCGASVVA